VISLQVKILGGVYTKRNVNAVNSGYDFALKSERLVETTSKPGSRLLKSGDYTNYDPASPDRGSVRVTAIFLQVTD